MLFLPQCQDARSHQPFCPWYGHITMSRLWRPGGIRSVVAVSLLVKQQLPILNRPRQRAPNLRTSNRFVAGFFTRFIEPARRIHSAIVLKPSTLLNLHRALKKRKHGILFHKNPGENPAPNDHPETHQGYWRHERAQSIVGLPANRPTNWLGFRCCHR